MISTVRTPIGTPRIPTPRDLDRAVSAYSRITGWNVYVDRAGRLAANTGSGFDAVTLPPTLGARVHRELSSAMLTAPVIVDASLGRWTLLTGIALIARMNLPPDLITARVRAVPRGAPVLLPVPLADGWDGQRHWVSSPDESALPPWTAVVGAARRVVDRGSR